MQCRLFSANSLNSPSLATFRFVDKNDFELRIRPSGFDQIFCHRRVESRGRPDFITRIAEDLVVSIAR